MQAKAIRINEPGGPEVLRYEDVEVPAPGPGEALVRHSAVGLNYIDIYLRSGVYPLPSYPAGLGFEAAGTVEAIGEGVTEVKPGDRVAYAGAPIGAYAQARVMPAHRLIVIPQSIDFETGAAMMLQGMTVEYLIRRTYEVKPGDKVLFHAAAGGVGLIACQWLSDIGATVIGTVGSEEKATLAKDHGCHHTINYREENFTDQVKELTNGTGVDVVYDSIGADTWVGSLDCLRPRGMMVTYGNSSGVIKDVDLGILSQKGSLYVSRPTLFSYTDTRQDLELSAGRLIDMIVSDKVKIRVNQRYALADVAQAHIDLEARKTTGSTVLLP